MLNFVKQIILIIFAYLFLYIIYMKQFLFSLFFWMAFLTNLFSQDNRQHLTFEGIPIDGSYLRFLEQLNKNGYDIETHMNRKNKDRSMILVSPLFLRDLKNRRIYANFNSSFASQSSKFFISTPFCRPVCRFLLLE